MKTVQKTSQVEYLRGSSKNLDLNVKKRINTYIVFISVSVSESNTSEDESGIGNAGEHEGTECP